VQSNLARSISDAGWSQFFHILSGKAAEAGRRVVAVNPAYTSQRCRICGHTEKGNRVEQANFRCLSCGHTENADVNAAKNILARAIAIRRERWSHAVA
ncbi:transposase, partial [Staphylococcus aureus]|nr:transposase [Staphylococcus aureus]